MKYCVGLSVSLKTPVPVYLVQSLTFTFPHAASALLRPAQKWILQQDDVPYSTLSTQVQELQEFCFLVLSDGQKTTNVMQPNLLSYSQHTIIKQIFYENNWAWVKFEGCPKAFIHHCMYLSCMRSAALGTFPPWSHICFAVYGHVTYQTASH